MRPQVKLVIEDFPPTRMKKLDLHPPISGKISRNIGDGQARWEILPDENGVGFFLLPRVPDVSRSRPENWPKGDRAHRRTNPMIAALLRGRFPEKAVPLVGPTRCQSTRRSGN